MSDRRESQRYTVSLLVEVSGDQERQSARATDLSATGIRVILPKALGVPTAANVHLFLLDERAEAEQQMIGPLDLSGQVVWCKPTETNVYEAGIQFDPMSDEDRGWVEHFLLRTQTRHRILIVEDSPTMRQLIKFSLRSLQGLITSEANNGVEALERLAEESVDLILLDLTMPVMDGVSFLENLKSSAIRPVPSIIVITTAHDQKSVERVQALGIDALVRKPVQSVALSSKVHEVLERRRSGTPAVRRA